MSNIDKQAPRESAESTIGILENIAGFEPSDIDGDTVELRFETEDGFDTGCDVSIVDQCQKAADVVRALLDELEAADKAAASGIEWMKRCLAAEKLIAELEAREVTLPDVEKWRSPDAVRAQNAYRVLVGQSLAAAGIRINGEG